MSSIPVRIPPGSDLRRFLDAYTFPDSSRSGFVIAGIGSLADPRLRFAGEPSETTIAGPVELLTISGSLSANGAHLHVTIADARGSVFGGHLGHGSIVRTTAEVLLAPVAGFELTREHDPLTGYAELVVREGRTIRP